MKYYCKYCKYIPIAVHVFSEEPIYIYWVSLNPFIYWVSLNPFISSFCRGEKLFLKSK